LVKPQIVAGPNVPNPAGDAVHTASEKARLTGDLEAAALGSLRGREGQRTGKEGFQELPAFFRVPSNEAPEVLKTLAGFLFEATDL
jgi:hypothetical protein